jgi:hypothetical protein
VLASDPSAGEENVDRAAAFRIWLDRPILPRDVNRANVSVRSGAENVFLGLRFDPVDRLLVAEATRAALHPTVVYRLRVENLRDLDLVPMGEAFEITFATGEEALGEALPPPLAFADVSPIFRDRCATAGCHTSPAPALGLDLSSGEAVLSTAVGVPAEQVRVGVEDERVWHGTSTLAGLARIDVAAGIGRPAFSYLLYKVLGDPHALGVRMPPDPAPALTDTELALLSRWILEGAPTD